MYYIIYYTLYSCTLYIHLHVHVHMYAYMYSAADWQCINLISCPSKSHVHVLNVLGHECNDPWQSMAIPSTHLGNL